MVALIGEPGGLSPSPPDQTPIEATGLSADLTEPPAQGQKCELEEAVPPPWSQGSASEEVAAPPPRSQGTESDEVSTPPTQSQSEAEEPLSSPQRQEDEAKHNATPLQVVWINDAPYDVTGFEKWHPGGDYIRDYLGRDATTAFHAFHPQSAHGWLPRRLVKADALGALGAAPDCAAVPPKASVALRASYLELHARFRARGWMEPSVFTLLKNLGLSAAFFAPAFWLPWRGSARLPPVVLGVLLGMGLHQLGYTVHDTMHGHVVAGKAKATWLGSLLGNVFFGAFGRHWDLEHVGHHAMANDIDADPQQRNAPFITVDRRQLTDKKERLRLPRRVERWFLRINHWFWLLGATWGGRVALEAAGLDWALRGLPWRLPDVAGIALSWTWLAAVISRRCDSYPVINGRSYGPALAMVTSLLVEGVLHIQLLANHASRPMTVGSEEAEKDWVSVETHVTTDILTPRWADWFHGGLNTHLSHHLFPRVRSDKLRDATPEVYAMLQQNGEKVHTCRGLMGAVAATTDQLVKACEDGGEVPWFAWGIFGKSSYAPAVYWLSVHVVMFGALPAMGVSAESYGKAWLGVGASSLLLVLAPLVGLA